MKKANLLNTVALLCALSTGYIHASSDLVDIPADMLSKGVNESLRANDATGTGYTKAVGDFDGDGKPDYASLKLESPTSKGYKLVVSLSGANGREQLLKAGDDVEAIGIKTVKPGAYETACGKGAGPRTDTCTNEISLEHEGISLFTFESAASFLYWKNGQFEEAFITD